MRPTPRTTSPGIVFNGTTAYASAAHNAEFNLAGSWTIEFWINGGAQGSAKYLLSHTDGSSAGWAVYTGGSSNMRAYFGNGSGLTVLSDPGANPWDSTWRHFAIVKDGSAGTLALYGTPTTGGGSNADVLWVSSSDGGYSAAAYTGTLYVGSYDGTQLYYAGSMDDLRIWNVARTLSQINAAKDAELTSLPSSLIAYYRFDENTGTTAGDATTTPENLTLHNTTWGTGYLPLPVTGLMTGESDGKATTSGTISGSSFVAHTSTIATVGAVLGPSGGSTQNHMVYAQNTGRWWFFTWGGTLDSGTASGGTNQTLVDSSKNWAAQVSSGAFTGRSCIITAGTGAGNAFEIGTVTSTSIKLQDNGDPNTPYTLNFTPDSTTQYTIVESRTIKSYVSDREDLANAIWSAASGGETSVIVNGVGVDVAGGRWDGGGMGGEYPTDGRQLHVAYANISGSDVIYVMLQTGVHWTKQGRRGRITASTTMTWDDMIPSTNTWDDTFGDQEALPYFLQAFAQCFDTNNSRWHTIWCKTQGMAGSAWTVNDPGTGTAYTLGAHWGGYVQTNTYDNATSNNSGTNFPYQAALAEVGSSGTMLAVYCNGNIPSTPFGAGKATQTGLRYTLSSTATTWPTTNVGAAVPSLNTAANSPNDWGIARVSTSDIHIVRRNSSTVLEHIRYNGSSWGSVVTLPSSGLTGHLAGSGVVLATDGTDVYCVLIDTDSTYTIRFCKWTASTGLWDAAWSATLTDTHPKAFLTGHRQLTPDKKIGLAWSEGSLPNVSAIAAMIDLGAHAATVTTTQAQSLASLKQAQLARRVNQAQLLAVPQAVTLTRALSVASSVAQATQAQLIRGITQAQSLSIAVQKVLLLARSIGQAQSVSLASAEQLTRAMTQVQVARLSKQVNLPRAVVETTAVALQKQAQLIRSVSQAQSLVGTIQKAYVLVRSLGQAQSLAIGRQARLIRTVSQAQLAAVVRGMALTVRLVQTQALAVAKRANLVRALSQTQTLAYLLGRLGQQYHIAGSTQVAQMATYTATVTLAPGPPGQAIETLPPPSGGASSNYLDWPELVITPGAVVPPPQGSSSSNDLPPPGISVTTDGTAPPPGQAVGGP